MELFVGTYGKTLPFVEAHGEGVGYFELASGAGKAVLQSVLAWKPADEGTVPQNPSYLARHPRLPVLYATEELLETGRLWSFAIDQERKTLSVLDKVDTLGNSAAFVSISKDGRFAYVANYSVEKISPAVVFALDENGRVGEPTAVLSCENTPGVNFPGPNAARQDVPHPHMCIEEISASGERLALVLDLGSDCVHEFVLDKDGKETSHGHFFLPGGSGPRHLAIRAADRSRFVLCEMTSMLCVVPCRERRGDSPAHASLRDATQAISIIDGSDRPCSDTVWTSAAIQLHPNDRFLYCSVRSTEPSRTGRVALFHLVDADDGSGTRVEFVCCLNSRGRCPREMKLDPSGSYLYVAHQDSSNVECFAVDPESGMLRYESAKSFEFGTPVSLCFSASAPSP